MQINPQIYREYDIRGVVDKDLTPAIVKRLGQGFGTSMIQHGQWNLVVGRDGRLSSKSFADALTEGLLHRVPCYRYWPLPDTGLLFFHFPSGQRRWNDGDGEPQSS
jgi:phosphomannomutase